MTYAIAWVLTFWIGNGRGDWQGGYFPDGSPLGTLGQEFSPAPGWRCSYEEGRRSDRTVYRFVFCLNGKTRAGAELEVDACDKSTPEAHARMGLLDFTAPDASTDRTGEVAKITLGCVFGPVKTDGGGK